MKALYNITYGLYVLTAKDKKHNGCIINTLIQVTSVPNQISITVNKDNHTTKMIEKTGEFNVSILDKNVNFELIKRFGFQSGKKTNKFEGFNDYKIAKNGVSYVTANTIAYLSGKVVSKIDVGTHITFVAEVTADEVLSSAEPVTYAYYISNIKPKTDVKKKSVYVCRICGYVYEGDKLPEDFICPICKHGAEDFELVETKKEENKGTQELSRIVKEEKKIMYYCPVCGNIENNMPENEECVICKAKMIEVEI